MLGLGDDGSPDEATNVVLRVKSAQSWLIVLSGPIKIKNKHSHRDGAVVINKEV